MPLLTAVNATLSRWCMKVAVISLLGIVAVVIWQVFGRYVLNNTPTYAEQLALLLVIIVAMFGAAAGVRDAGHIGMDSILVLLPDRLRRAIEVIIHVLVLIFAVVMTVCGWQMMVSVWGYATPNLFGTPQGASYIPVVIAGVLITSFSIEHILAIFLGTEVEPSWH